MPDNLLQTRATISVRECANLLGVDPQTIRNHIRDGHLRAVTLVGRVLIPTDQIRDLLSGDDAQ